MHDWIPSSQITIPEKLKWQVVLQKEGLLYVMTYMPLYDKNVKNDSWIIKAQWCIYVYVN